MPRNNLSSELVLAAAIARADKEGLRQLSLKQLAGDLDVKPPALYNHIESLDHLRADLAINGLTQLCDQMRDAAVGKTGDEAVRHIGIAYVSFAKEHPGLYEATQWTNTWNNDPRVIAASDRIISLLEQIFEPYQFSEKELCNTIRAFRSLCHGFASLDLNSGFGNPIVDSSESFNEALEIMLTGIRFRYADHKE